MSLPYFNLYPKDFEAKTSHLTLEEDGAYNRLLRLCWMSPGCKLPDDDTWIMRRMRVDKETYDRVVKVVIDEFFIRDKQCLSNARMVFEFLKSSASHKKRVEAGIKGGNSKSLKNNKKTPSNASGNAKAMLKQPEPEPLKEKTTKKKGFRISEEWEFSDKMKAYAKEKGLTAMAAETEAEKFVNHWLQDSSPKALKTNWDAAFRNWVLNAIKFTPRLAEGNKPEGWGFG